MPLHTGAEPVPLGAYLTDGDQLVEVVESDHAGVLGEDARDGTLVSIEASELSGPDPHWRRVRPA